MHQIKSLSCLYRTHTNLEGAQEVQEESSFVNEDDVEDHVDMYVS